MIQNEKTFDSSPRHLAIGHLNNDENEDMAIVNTAIDCISIQFGSGNGTFGNPIIHSTGNGSQPYWIGIAHLNNDNHSDIIVANYGTNSIGVFLGDNDGKFRDYQIYSLGPSRPMSFSIGHLNNDDRFDIGVICNGTISLIILFGKGDGSFQIGRTYTLGYDSMPRSILLNDFNGDHRSDLIILNSGTNQFILFLSNSNETFVRYSYSTGIDSHPSSMAVNHFNSDLYLDIVILSSNPNNLLIFYGDSSGLFQTKPKSISIKGSDLRSIVSGHFTNDQIVDLAIVDSKENSLLIYKGNEDGVFSLSSEQSTGYRSEPYSIIVSDLNKDNQSELIVVNNGNNNILLFSFYKYKITTQQRTYPTGANSYPMQVKIVDVNKDDNGDIIVLNTYGSNIGVFIGFGNGTFQNQIVTPMYYSSYYPTSFDIADFNNDKTVDVVVLIPDYDIVLIYLGFGNGSFYYKPRVQLAHFTNIQSIIVADFNKDNESDIATGDYNTDQIGVYLLLKNVTSYYQYHYNLTGNDLSPISLATGYLNNDSYLDLVSANGDTPTLTILFGRSGGTFQKAISIDLGYYFASSIIIGDMNNDGKQDIVLSSSYNNTVVVLIGDGNGGFSTPYQYITTNGSVSWAHNLAYFNKDDLLDIVVVDPIDSSVVVFLMNQNESLIEKNVIPIEYDYSPYCISTGDLNNDRETDIVVGNSDSDGITVLLMKYQPIFANQINYNQGSGKHPNAINAGDFNNDQQMDLVVANSGRNNIQIFLDYHNGQFQNKVDYFTGDNSYPRYIASGHFDRNNLTDIAIVNYGKSSLIIILNPLDENFNRSFEYFTGGGSFPSSLVIDDVNNDGWSDVILTNSAADNIGVFLGYDYSTLIVDQTLTFERKSSPEDVIIEDFNGDSIWDLVIVFGGQATVKILLGYANSTFEEQFSYKTNKLHDTIKVVTGQFNNDSYLDLAITSSESHTLSILFGDGDGIFSPSIDYSTDPSSPVFVTSADLNRDGHQDFVVASKDTDNIGVFLANENGSLNEQVIYHMPEESAPVWIAIDDLNKDNISDLAVANLNGDGIGIYFGVGDGKFNNFTFYAGNKSLSSSLTIADFDKDNYPDIAVLNAGAKNITIFYGYGNGTFSSPIKYSMKQNSILTSMIVQDLNNDSILDIAVTNFVDGNANIGILYGLDERRFLPAKMHSTGYLTQSTVMTVKDINNDGQLDFVVSLAKKDKVLFMSTNGSEPLGSLMTFYTGLSSSPSAVAISHLNNDHKLDIAVVNSGTNDVLVLLGDGNGNFIQEKRYSTGANTLPNSIVVKDMDNDQRNDIIVTNSKKDEIRIFYNDGNGSFALFHSYSTGYGSEPSFVSVGDLDKDNMMDIVLANTGINTVLILYGSGYRTFAKEEIYSFNYDSRPKSIVIADVDNDGWLDIGVAHYQSGVVHVLLHTCQLGQTIF